MTTIAVRIDKDIVSYAADSMASDGIIKYNHMGKIIHMGDILMACAGTRSTISMFEGHVNAQRFDGSKKYAKAYEEDVITDDLSFMRVMESYIMDLSGIRTIEEDDRIDFIATNIKTGSTAIGKWTDVRILPADSFWAIGTGSEFAIGAMETGYSPKGAVAIAAKHDLYSSYPIVHTTIENSIVASLIIEEK